MAPDIEQLKVARDKICGESLACLTSLLEIPHKDMQQALLMASLANAPVEGVKESTLKLIIADVHKFYLTAMMYHAVITGIAELTEIDGVLHIRKLTDL